MLFHKKQLINVANTKWGHRLFWGVKLVVKTFFRGGGGVRWGWGVGWVPLQPDCFKLSENRKSQCTTDFGLFLNLSGP